MQKSYVYIATNNTATIYIGVTADIEGRANQHFLGEGSVFASRYGIKHMVYIEEFSEIELAIAREKQLKGWRREKKLSLINLHNPAWNDLFMGPSATLRVTEGRC